MRKIVISSFLLLTLPFAGRGIAQNGPKTAPEGKSPETAKALETPVHFYHLDLVVKEIGENGKPSNSRTFSITVSTARGEYDSIRAGSRFPIATGSYSGAGAGAPVNIQFHYEDLGVNFDVREVRETENRLAMSLQADISGLGSSVPLGGPRGIEEPVMRHNKWGAPVFLSIGKPTVVFTSDDVDSKGGMEVVVTATQLQ